MFFTHTYATHTMYLNRTKIYDPSIVSERDMRFYAETQQAHGYIAPRRIDTPHIDDGLRQKWILADRKHFAQWRLRKMRRLSVLQERAQRKIEAEIEEERVQLEALFWKEAPIMRPRQWAEWEKYNWPQFYAERSLLINKKSW